LADAVSDGDVRNNGMPAAAKQCWQATERKHCLNAAGLDPVAVDNLSPAAFEQWHTSKPMPYPGSRGTRAVENTIAPFSSGPKKKNVPAALTQRGTGGN
jgi:hypothetical protein